MWRAIGAFIIVIGLTSHADAEETTLFPDFRWSAAIITPKKAISKPPQAIPVQLQDDPICDFGVGPCGGTCNEEGKKPWKCLSVELPCYKPGGRCKCEAASMCQPKIR